MGSRVPSESQLCLSVGTVIMRGITILLLWPLAMATHYEDPKDGCGSDEQAVRIQGISGDFCSPACKGSMCPTDPPSASDAKPTCALQSPTGSKYCALVCTPGDNGACPEGASCQSIQGTGICTYPAGQAEAVISEAFSFGVVDSGIKDDTAEFATLV